MKCIQQMLKCGNKAEINHYIFMVMVTAIKISINLVAYLTWDYFGKILSELSSINGWNIRSEDLEFISYKLTLLIFN